MTVATFFLDLLVRSTLWMALVWIAAAAVRRSGGSSAMLHLVWLLGLLGLALLPVLAALMPSLALPVLPGDSTPVAVPPPPVAAAASAAAPVSATPDALGAAELAALLYLVVAAALLVRLALGRALLARLWRRSRPADTPGWTGLVALLAGALGIRRRVALRIAEGPAMPMTWGTLRPRILLPAMARGWSDEQRRIVLLHELGHVSRFDSFSRAAAAVVCALYWFHPAAWYAARQMRIEQEHACDDLVLMKGAGATVYARNLLEAARAFEAPPILARISVAMVATSELERRLLAIVRRRPRRRAGARFTFGFGVAAFIGTAVAASVTPVAAADPPALPSAPAAPAPIASEPMPPVASAGDAPELARASAPRAPVRSAPVPVGATEPVPPVPVVAPVAPVAPALAPAGDDYDRRLAEYHRDLRTYNAAQRRYNSELASYHRELAALSAQGNLANSGNTGHSGNPGNPGRAALPEHRGRPPVPAVLPTPPTLPTSPTPPTPLKPRSQGP